MNAIVADGVTKTYRIGVGRARVREMLPWPLDGAVQRAFPRWWTKDTFNALEDVSFSVPAGGGVGLIGHNGAGKTTMLKTIAGVTSPTGGSVKTSGRVAALIDVLVGFHPDLTGRENTYLLGAIYGFGRKEMKARIERILEFAEIDELADTPLKRYSTGMMARLGFGIIASLDMEVFLVDEVLTVGDVSFQRKCGQWLRDYREDGGTLVFVSHNLALMRSMTDRVVWLDHGKLVEDGPTAEVLANYARAMEHRETDRPGLVARKAKRAMRTRGLHRWGAGGARLVEVHIEEPTQSNPGCTFRISYEDVEISEALFAVGFIDESSREIGGAVSSAVALNNQQGAIQCRIDPLPLTAGIYFPVITVLTPDGVVRDRWRLDRAVVVDGQNGEAHPLGTDFGPVAIPSTWTTDKVYNRAPAR